MTTAALSPAGGKDPKTASRKIVLSQVAGFCFGVRRAVDITLRERSRVTGAITTVGPVVHNAQVTDRLRSEGVEQAAGLDEVSSGTIVISAHGTAPQLRTRALDKGLRILDVTCPFVTKVHRSAKQLMEQGYQVILVGDPGHTEVEGVVGAIEACGGRITVVSARRGGGRVARSRTKNGSYLTNHAVLLRLCRGSGSGVRASSRCARHQHSLRRNGRAAAGCNPDGAGSSSRNRDRGTQQREQQATPRDMRCRRHTGLSDRDGG